MPALPAECRDRLLRIVDASLNAALLLEQFLRDERQALEQQNSDAIGAAADGKRDCVERLQRLEAEREAACRTAGQAEGAEHMPALLSSCGDGVADGWQRFLAIAGNCDRMNTANGAIIHLRRRQFAAALDIISGSGSTTIDTYGASGASRTTRAPRALGEI